MSGVATGIIPGHLLDTPVTYEDLAAIGSGLGSAGFIVLDETVGVPPEGAGTGTIIIEKVSNPAGGTGFGFTETMTASSFSLDDGQTTVGMRVQLDHLAPTAVGQSVSAEATLEIPASARAPWLASNNPSCALTYFRTAAGSSSVDGVAYSAIVLALISGSSGILKVF